MKVHTFRALLMLLTTVALVAVTAQNVFMPARYRAGPLPTVPIQAIGGGEVFLEVALSKTGRVDLVTPLRVTPPFVDALLAALQRWQFRPAEDEDSTSPRNPKPRRPVESKVLVAGLFRPPALSTPSLGTLPTDVAQGSEIPHPTATVTPAYPPEALFSGVVLVEVEIAPTGLVTKTTVIRSAPPFDGPAVDAARRWTFRPARRQGRSVAGVVYIVFGFAQPVTAPHRR